MRRVCESSTVAALAYFSLHAVHGAKRLDRETAERIGRTAHADVVELRESGTAVFGFDPAHDAATIRGHLEMAARIELGAHWHTRYELAAF